MGTLFASMIAGLLPTLAVVYSYKKSSHRIEEVHGLVNSRLTEALGKIERFEHALGLERGEEPGGDKVADR